MNRTQVKAQIDAFIKANGVKSITGPVLNNVLTMILDNFLNLESDTGLIGLKEHDPTVAYTAGEGVFKDGFVWEANVDNEGAFDSANWTNTTSRTLFKSYLITADGVNSIYTQEHDFGNDELIIDVYLIGASNTKIYPIITCDSGVITIQFMNEPDEGTTFKILATGIQSSSSTDTFDNTFDNTFS